MYRSILITGTLITSLILAIGFYAMVQLSQFQTLTHDSDFTQSQPSLQANLQPLFLFTLPARQFEQRNPNPSEVPTTNAVWPQLSAVEHSSLDKLQATIEPGTQVWLGTAAQLYKQLALILTTDLLPALILLLAIFTLYGLSHARQHYGYSALFSTILLLTLMWVAASSRLGGAGIAQAFAELLNITALSARELQQLLLLGISSAAGYYVYRQFFTLHRWHYTLRSLCIIQSLATLLMLGLYVTGQQTLLSLSLDRFITTSVIICNLLLLCGFSLNPTATQSRSRLTVIAILVCGYSLALVDFLTPLPGSSGLPLFIAAGLLFASLNNVRSQILLQRHELDLRLERELNEKTASLETSNKELLKIKYDLQVANLELKALSFTDALTSAYNRLYFDRQFLTEWQRARREQEPMSLILVDIDRFKELNDTYGHLAGDEGLKLITQLLRKGFQRGNDIVCRYGGEEFVILLPNTLPQQAAIRAEKLRELIELTPVVYNEDSITITASFGVCGLVPQPEHEPLDLLHATDQALYWVKRNGRNGVHISERLAKENPALCDKNEMCSTLSET